MNFIKRLSINRLGALKACWSVSTKQSRVVNHVRPHHRLTIEMTLNMRCINYYPRKQFIEQLDNMELEKLTPIKASSAAPRCAWRLQVVRWYIHGPALFRPFPKLARKLVIVASTPSSLHKRWTPKTCSKNWMQKIDVVRFCPEKNRTRSLSSKAKSFKKWQQKWERERRLGWVECSVPT